MGHIKTKEQIKETLDALKIIKEHCNYEGCRNCILGEIEEPCMFLNRPYQWNLGELEEKLDT